MVLLWSELLGVHKADGESLLGSSVENKHVDPVVI